MSWKGLLGWRKKEEDNDSWVPGRRGLLSLLTLIFVVAVFSCCVLAKKPVVVVVDGEETTVQTFSRTVGGFLKSQNIVLLEKDEVIPSIDTPLKKGMVVTVNRAVDVSIAVDGQELQLRTRGQTVKDVLEEYGINIGAEDEVAPGCDAPVLPGTKVHIARIQTDTVVDETAIDYEVKKEYTTRLPQGSTRVAQEGREGTERRTWQVTYRDGNEVNRQLVSREVISAPANKVVMVGSGMIISRGGENIRYSKVMNMLATAYTYTGNNTASGTAPHYGVAAVDTGVIPMGTRLYVDNYGYATALDRGSAIKGNRIDLFFETRSEAVNWGLRKVKVYILD